MKNIILMSALLAMSGCACHTVEPGERSVMVDWGKVQEPVLGEGFHTGGFFWGIDFHDVSVRQQKKELNSECFSSDLQHVGVKMAVLYRIPEANVIKVFRDYNGEPFDVLIAPRAQEALKEVTAIRTAEQIAKQREAVKVETLDALRKKVGDTLVLEDLIIENIDLSKELGQAIEQKMVQEQEAAKAKFTKQKAEIDAEIAIAKAKGEADSSLLKAEAEAKAIKIRGDALRQNPSVIQLELINKWDGVSPRIVAGTGTGTSLLLPVGDATQK